MHSPLSKQTLERTLTVLDAKISDARAARMCDVMRAISVRIETIEAIRHTFSGMVKLLYPAGVVNSDDARELLVFAMEHRKRVADQLPRIDATMKHVTFGYRARGSEVWTIVKTPEEQEFPTIYYKGERKPIVDGVQLLHAEFDDTPPF